MAEIIIKEADDESRVAFTESYAGNGPAMKAELIDRTQLIVKEREKNK